MMLLKDSNNEAIPLIVANAAKIQWAPVEKDMLLTIFCLNKSANDASELLMIAIPSRETI